MKRQQRVRARGEPQRLPRRPVDRRRDMRPQGVHHAVAYEMHPVAGDSLTSEIEVPALFGREQQLSNVVRDNAVDLLGHRTIERA